MSRESRTKDFPFIFSGDITHAHIFTHTNIYIHHTCTSTHPHTHTTNTKKQKFLLSLELSKWESEWWASLHSLAIASPVSIMLYVGTITRVFEIQH